MSNGAERTPDASGDFLRYPFPRLLFFLHKKNFLGELHLEQPGRWKGLVFFRDGLPVRADIPSSQDVLGRVLLERGLIDENAFNRSLQELAKGQALQGQILLQMGALTQEGLVEGLRIQLHRKLMRLFPLTEVQFRLFSGEHPHGLKDEAAQVRADTLYVIFHGVRHFYSDELLLPELAKLPARPLRLKPQAIAALARFAMGQDETALTTLLAHSAMELDEVLRVSSITPTATRMLMYTLWVTELLEAAPAVVRSRPPAGQALDAQIILAPVPPEEDELPPPLPPAPDPSSEPMVLDAAQPMSGDGDLLTVAPLPIEEDEEENPAPIMASSDEPSSMLAKTQAAGSMRRQIKEMHERIRDKTHYQVLELPQDASKEAIRNAYFKLAKVYHPDRANALGLRDVAQLAEEIFTRISEAHNTLSHDESRKEYDETLAGRNTKKEAMSAVEAEFIFQKGLFFFRKKDYREALKHFQEAYTLNPQEGEHLAWSAWTLYMDPRRDRFQTYEEVKEKLDKALAISPHSATCHYFMGELLAAQGKDEEAIKFFNQTLEIQPDHMDAERHVRLIRIRQDKKRAAGDKARGLFGRLMDMGKEKEDSKQKDKGKDKKKDKQKEKAGRKW